MLRDADIRKPLLESLRDRGVWHREETGLTGSSAVVDVLSIDDVVHGYEIKSEADSLARLSKQAGTYGRTLERVTLVLATRHLDAALKIVPEWWGVLTASIEDEGVVLDPFRSPRDNPELTPLQVAAMFWRSELYAILKARGIARGLSRAPWYAMNQRLCDHASFDELKALLRQALRTRAWTGREAVT